MKILFITRHYFPDVGGIEQNIAKVSEFLKDRHEVRVLTVSREGSPANETIEGVTVLRRGFREFLSFNLKDHDAVFLENFNLLPHLFVMVNVIKDSLRKKRNYRLFFVPHGGFTPYWPMFNLSARLVKKLAHRFIGLPFINKYADKVIAVSNWEEGILKQSGINRPITLIRNGVELRQSKDSEKENFFVFIGRIDAIKNIEEIIRTFKIISDDQDFQNHELKIIGNFQSNKDYYNQLRECVLKNNLIDKVKFLGEKRGEEKYKILAKAECLFCLSHFESDSLVIKEAFSVRTKVCINTNAALNDYKHERNIFIKEQPEIDLKKFRLFLAKPFESNIEIPLISWESVAKK